MSKRFIVIGAGISGISACELLLNRDKEVTLYDGNVNIDAKELVKKNDFLENVDIIIGDIDNETIKGFDKAIVSPGIPLDIDVVKMIKANNIPIWGEIELAYHYGKGKLVAITGTNGKTTTTSLTGALMSDKDNSAYIGGNIGVPVSSFCLNVLPINKAVLEVSSFQLESTINFCPHIACILNITPDHLNRHKTMENYINAKLQVYKNQTEKDYLVLNLDDPILKGLDLSCVRSKVYYFSLYESCRGCYLDGDNIYFNDGQVDKFIMNVSEICLIGEHNVSNVLASLTMAILSGCDITKLCDKVHNFKGVAHRLEYVAEVKGVVYINDSKATNISSTMVAVQAITKSATLILGGSDKGLDFDHLFKSLPPSIIRIITLGETKGKILKCAEKYTFTCIYQVDNLKKAVNLAYELSANGEVVLLSPACASFDMFSNYEERGKAFKKYVTSLKT